MKYSLINGEPVESSAASIKLNDIGLLRGYGVFDFFRILKRVPIFIEDHLARLERSAGFLGITLPWTRNEISDMCRQIIELNNIENAGLKIVVTGGYSDNGFYPSDPNIYITTQELPTYDPSGYENGGKLIVSNYTRDFAEAKTIYYAHAVRMIPEIAKAGAIEVVYHSEGKISECSRSNIFFVKDSDKLYTPQSSLLHGITRKNILELAEGRFDTHITDVHIDSLNEFSEAFITSSTKGVYPISKIGDTTIGDGRVGPVSKALMKLLEERVNDRISAGFPLV